MGVSLTMKAKGGFNEKSKVLGAWTVLFAGLFTVAALLPPVPAEARDIKIGIVDTYSGPAAVFGNDALNGFKLAVDEINKQGVLGGKIVFTTRDEQFKVDIGLNMARSWFSRRTWMSWSAPSTAEPPWRFRGCGQERKVPFIVWTAKSENITGKAGHRYVFSTAENTAMVGKSAASLLPRSRTRNSGSRGRL